MQIARLGRFVFVAQWFAALLLPLFVFLGRGAVGGELGWMALIGIVYGVFVILLLLVPPLITLFDREVRAERAERTVFAGASIALWVSLVIVGLSIPDSGDSGHLDSAISNWFGVPYEASTVVFGLFAALAGLTYFVTFILAIAGIAAGSSPRATTALADDDLAG